MDGFWVDLGALDGAAWRIHQISIALKEELDRLYALQKPLSMQEGYFEDEREELRKAASKMQECVETLAALSRKAQAISELYAEAEAFAVSTIANLPAASAVAAQATAGAKYYNDTVRTVNVQSSYRLDPSPVMFFANQLPCEQWLQNRVIRNMMGSRE